VGLGLRRISRHDWRNGDARARPGDAQQNSLALGDLVENVGPELAENLAAGAFRLDDAGDLEAADVPGDERLAEADGFDEIADRCRPFRQALDYAQAVHVRECLVEDAQLAQVVGLIDDRGDGASEVRWRRQKSGLISMVRAAD
jgi:hypothetical protein